MDDNRKAFIGRIGTYFLVVGTGFTILFFASDFVHDTQFTYFFLGFFGMGYGWYLRHITAPPKKPSNRFEWLRKYNQQRKEKQGNRHN